MKFNYITNKHAATFIMVALFLFSNATNAIAATNPTGSTIPNMEATQTDNILLNDGNVVGGRYFISNIVGIDGFFGMGAFNISNANIKNSSTGSILINSNTNNAIGILNEGMSGFIQNDGLIDINTTDNQSQAIVSFGNNNMILNNGRIFVNSTDNNSGGIVVNGDNASIINSGNIDINALGIGNSIAIVGNNSNIINTGNISVSANTHATGFVVRDDNNTINNSGTISIIAGPTGEAYGIQLIGDNNTINNYIVMNIAGGNSIDVDSQGNFNIGTYAMTLRDWTDNDTVFRGTTSTVVTFGDGINGATLILHPDSADKGFAFEKEFNIANMVFLYDGVDSYVQQTQFTAGELEGFVENVIAGVDFVSVELGGTSTAPTVSMGLLTDKLPTSYMNSQVISTLLMQMGNIAKSTNEIMLDSYFDNANDMNNWSMFFAPYGGYTFNNDYDYGLGYYGVSLGSSYNFNRDFSLGLHLDVNGFQQLAENGGDTKNNGYSFLFGVHSSYFLLQNWYAGADVSGVFGCNYVLYGVNGVSASEDFISSALLTSLNTGYVFAINNSNFIVPEVGISYLYYSNNDYELNFNDVYSGYNMAVDGSNISSFYVSASVAWEGNFSLGTGIMSPSVSVGARQNISGSDFDYDISIAGSKRSVTVSTIGTSFITNIGTEWVKNNFSIGLFYDGEFSSKAQSHQGNLEFTYLF